MDPSLISRFDLIYLLIDYEREDKDWELGQHILDLYDDRKTQDNILDTQTMCKYIEYAWMVSRP